MSISETQKDQLKKQLLRIRLVLSDAFTFVRSAELNQAVAAVTLEQLISDQILRNGETDQSNASTYNPYAFDPDNLTAAGDRPLARANFLGGADTNAPTRIERVTAIKTELEDLVKSLKAFEPQDIEDADELTAGDAASTVLDGKVIDDLLQGVEE